MPLYPLRCTQTAPLGVVCRDCGAECGLLCLQGTRSDARRKSVHPARWRDAIRKSINDEQVRLLREVLGITTEEESHA